MVVSSKSLEPIQVLQCSVQRVGAALDGGRLGRRPRLEPSHLGGLFDRRGHRGQRMKRIQEIFRQGGHVSVRLHHVRQSPDRITNLCAWGSLQGSRRLLDQDANPGRHHRGFHPAFAQTLHPSLPETICVPTSPRPMLRGRAASSSDECQVLDPTG